MSKHSFTSEASATRQSAYLQRIRLWLTAFMVGLVISGVTAFPLETELRCLAAAVTACGISGTPLGRWILHVRDGLIKTYAQYPVIAYGTDWLAFGHLVIAGFCEGTGELGRCARLNKIAPCATLSRIDGC